MQSTATLFNPAGDAETRTDLDRREKGMVQAEQEQAGSFGGRAEASRLLHAIATGRRQAEANW